MAVLPFQTFEYDFEVTFLIALLNHPSLPRRSHCSFIGTCVIISPELDAKILLSPQRSDRMIAGLLQ